MALVRREGGASASKASGTKQTLYRLYSAKISGKSEPIEFGRGTCFSFHLVSN